MFIEVIVSPYAYRPRKKRFINSYHIVEVIPLGDKASKIILINEEIVVEESYETIKEQIQREE